MESRNEKYQKTIKYNRMKNLGILLIILGAIAMIASYFMEMSTNNTLTFGAMAVVILGTILHIVLNKKFVD